MRRALLYDSLVLSSALGVLVLVSLTKCVCVCVRVCACLCPHWLTSVCCLSVVSSSQHFCLCLCVLVRAFVVYLRGRACLCCRDCRRWWGLNESTAIVPTAMPARCTRRGGTFCSWSTLSDKIQEGPSHKIGCITMTTCTPPLFISVGRALALQGACSFRMHFRFADVVHTALYVRCE